MTPQWDDITAQTDRELQARRWLDDRGLRMSVTWKAAGRYRVTIRRGHRSLGLTLILVPVNGIERGPAPWDILGCLMAQKPGTDRRVRAFFTQRELDDLRQLVKPSKDGD